MIPYTLREIRTLSSKGLGISSPSTIPTMAQTLGGSEDGRSNTKIDNEDLPIATRISRGPVQTTTKFCCQMTHARHQTIASPITNCNIQVRMGSTGSQHRSATLTFNPKAIVSIQDCWLIACNAALASTPSYDEERRPANALEIEEFLFDHDHTSATI